MMAPAFRGTDETKSDNDVRYLVVLAGCGDEEAKLELYHRFRWFLLKYRALLKSGIFNAYSKERRDIRLFVSFYSKSPQIRGLLMSYRGIPVGQTKVVQAVNKIIGQLHFQCKSLGDEEIDSIIDMTFFQCANVYDPKRKVKEACNAEGLVYDKLTTAKQEKWDKEVPEVGFEGFMFNYFHFLLRKNLDTVLNGIQAGIGIAASGVETSTITVADDNPYADRITLQAKEFEDDLRPDEPIDSNWDGGSTAQWPWDELSQQERWLIKQRYHNKRFACEIGESVGMSASVIRNRIKAAKAKVIDVSVEDNAHYRWKRETEKEFQRSHQDQKREEETDRFSVGAPLNQSGPVTKRIMTDEEKERYGLPL
jgi:hypothetical protein